MWGIVLAAALAANPILERAHEAHAELRYEDALGLVELVLGQSNLSQADRAEALELRATLRASMGCTAEAIRAFQDLLAHNKQYKPKADASPKIRECFQLTLSTIPPEPVAKPKPAVESNATEANATAAPSPKPTQVIEVRREVVSVPPSGLVWGTFALSVAGVVASANLIALGWVEGTSLREDIRTYNESGGTEEDRAALRERKQRLRALDWAAVGAGVVGITAGVLWGYFNFSAAEPSVDVAVTAGGAQVWLRGSF